MAYKPYTPISYTTVNTIKRILRTSNVKVRIGDEPNDTISTSDVESYILDASRIIDSTLIQHVMTKDIPLLGVYAEISFAAPRVAAYLIYKDLTASMEDVPVGVKGWKADAEDYIKRFISNLDAGVYLEISPAKNGPNWETAQATFQNLIGVPVIHDMQPNVTGQTPDDSKNIGPYT